MKGKKTTTGDKEPKHNHNHQSDLFGMCKVPLISKDSDWKRLFDSLMILLAIYSTLMNAYTAAFGIIKNDIVMYWDLIV